MRPTMFLIAALLAFDASGQVVGASISGVVKDRSGAALPKSSVSIRNLDTGAERILITDDSGRYAAPSIPVGKYEVTGSKEGFAPQAKTGIALVVGEHTTLD